MGLAQYSNGKRILPPSGKLHSHQRLIMIDESGEIGSTSLFCVFVASITDHVKKVEKIIKVFPKGRRKNKHYNSLDRTKVDVLTELSSCDIDIYGISYKKSKLDCDTPKKKSIHVICQMTELIELVLKNDNGTTYNLVIDNTPLIDGYEDMFAKFCYKIAESCGKTIDELHIMSSSGTNVLKIHDYVAGTIGAHIENAKDAENECHERFGIVKSKIKEIIER